MSVRIVDAQPGQLADLEALQRRSSDVWEEDRDHLAAHPDAVVIAPEAIASGLLRVAMADDGTLKGFALTMPARRGVCEMDGLFVEPDAMRAGIGRALVEDAAALARAAGASAIEVTANPRAVGFYEKTGFAGTEEVPTRFGSGLCMRLDLGR